MQQYLIAATREASDIRPPRLPLCQRLRGRERDSHLIPERVTGTEWNIREVHKWHIKPAESRSIVSCHSEGCVGDVLPRESCVTATVLRSECGRRSEGD